MKLDRSSKNAHVHRTVVPLLLVLQVTGCISVERERMPARVARPQEQTLRYFAGTYRLVETPKKETGFGFMTYAKRKAGDKLILRESGSGLEIRYQPVEGAAQTALIGKKDDRVRWDDGRLFYRSRARYDSAPMFPGLAVAGGESQMYFDENGDLIVVTADWWASALLFIVPAYGRDELVHRFRPDHG
jgi:hypothetical protein